MIVAEKTEVQDLYKTGPGAFVYDTKRNEIEMYKKRRKELESKDQEINALKNQINNINGELSDIKNLLQILVQKVDK